ncbi:sugar ABC transporter permease [Oceanotoga sp. DSM 15011]|jgi:multiple sugar transport system permease protein|uniref:Carbohydrate ABC transporter membrane protein 1 (CUT1 family) n=1 Tax=Oceanotoga teriensis TaxID=515440 RepID=A0AA45C772_9BACT|nr:MULTISPECIES: sugar ABC transporter permease [Oceanotoga]MDN5341394.1 multiple sugar transport system permease protein [Oceanotoga sp.]MDO7975877.1 sugar ABC transporter permease [Oceanotoga teriensis]PWJ95146.1 carbohydrate ABC transporter membrane protein 1 (CUT1 family) [Oceanotoga teriensis]UYO99138.1 sugar ABC transporter permease [Oceanotoga sp. DSM 15011]
MKSRTRTNTIGLLFALPWLIGFLVFVLYPICASLFYSFTEYHITDTPKFVGFSNYIKMFQDNIFLKSITNTLFYTIFLVPVGLIVGIGLAILLVQPFKEVATYRALTYFPSIVPGYAFAVISLFFFHPYLGFVNNLLAQFGIEGPLWLNDPNWVKPTIILLSQWGAGGTALIMMAALKDIPKELYEAASIDGASRWKQFWKITLPLITPSILFYLITATFGALQIFDLPMLMTKGGPNNASLTYSMYLYKQAFSYMNMGYASAMAWIMFLIAIVFTLIYFGTSKKWVNYFG